MTIQIISAGSQVTKGNRTGTATMCSGDVINVLWHDDCTRSEESRNDLALFDHYAGETATQKADRLSKAKKDHEAGRLHINATLVEILSF